MSVRKDKRGSIMVRKFGGALVAATALALAAPAGAVTLVNSGCSLLTGCLFDGNDNKIDDVEAAYNAGHAGANLDLPSTFFKTEMSGNNLSANWTSTTPISYISVKAGPSFMLYQLASPATSGTLTSAGLLGPQGQQQAISHYTLFAGTGPAVPEPGVWMMMILGVGFTGLQLRRRRTQNPAFG